MFSLVRSSSLSASCRALFECYLSTQDAQQSLSQILVEPITTVIDLNCNQFAMLLSTDSIIAILSVLVALPPSILIVITVVRRLYHVPRYNHRSRRRCQYSSSHPNVSTYHSPF